MAQYGLGQSNPVSDVFSNTTSEVSSFQSIGDRNIAAAKNTDFIQSTKYFSGMSQVPISEVRNNVYYCERVISELLNEIETNLTQVNINPYTSIELETAHKAVWEDAVKHVDSAKDIQCPSFIPYAEYAFAEQHLCRSCRELVKQYDLTINHTTFGHLIDVKKILSYLRNEILTIKNIVTHQLGKEYADETEGEIAKQLSDWAKEATHYTKQLAQEITAPSSTIPETELDQISKKQAAQFQAFFSIKVNSYTSEIHSISNVIKRDSVDTCGTYYANFLLPAMTFKSSVIEPLVLDFTTTQLGSDCPTLTGELVVANNAVTGNLGSVSTDFIERRTQMSRRLEALVQLIRVKRRYVNYIVQLESVAVQRIKTISQVLEEDLNVYENIFQSIPVDSQKRQNLRSSHGDLDGLDGDAHPQYLRRDGGTIIGNIDIENGIKVGGIDISNHSHAGSDGSMPIKASSIDYTSARDEYFSSTAIKPYSNVRLASFKQNNVAGGGVYFDAIIEIDIEKEDINSYEFEILYNEI
jgi:hypothetical protein